MRKVFWLLMLAWASNAVAYTVTITWDAPTNPGTHYQFRFCTGTLADNSCVGQPGYFVLANVPHPTLTHTFANTNQGVRYYWNVGCNNPSAQNNCQLESVNRSNAVCVDGSVPAECAAPAIGFGENPRVTVTP